jgi:Zn finger protein HypA/HybF involved in hydrogenase expression
MVIVKCKMCGAQVEAKKLNRKYCDSCTSTETERRPADSGHLTLDISAVETEESR